MAGYPEAHPDVISEDPEKMKEAYWSDIHYLKEKVCITVACPAFVGAQANKVPEVQSPQGGLL